MFDPFDDDQSIVVKLNGKGLVVISGCAHAGIINTIMFAQKTTGEKNIQAVMEGSIFPDCFLKKFMTRPSRNLKN